MLGLTVFFARSISSIELNSSYFSSEAVIVHIGEVYIGLGEFYGL